ncbi:DUF5994 family protein [Streptomyces sp. cg28]|uniref:DUF5994 family protein n=1 Tax=Streptomyces sp. cg28 TaxID=3403457 RepID=UPI003B225AAF
MTATTTSTRPAAHPPSRAARVAPKPLPGSGLLDGAWWPRSRDLAAELPALADVLDPLWGRIIRVAVNPLLWPAVPREVTVHHRVLKVGWFTPELDPHKLLLLSYGTKRFDLLVIPPETGPASAARLMAAACEPDGPPLTATDLIAAESARHHDVAAADRQQSTEESWEYEGGATSTHPARTGAVTAVAAAPAAGALPIAVAYVTRPPDTRHAKRIALCSHSLFLPGRPAPAAPDDDAPPTNRLPPPAPADRHDQRDGGRGRFRARRRRDRTTHKQAR